MLRCISTNELQTRILTAAEIYRNLLAKRILQGRSISNDLERSMISKLK